MAVSVTTLEDFELTVDEDQFYELRRILGCLPGDLGRWKASPGEARRVCLSARLVGDGLHRLEAWCRKGNIPYAVTHQRRWTP